MDFEKLIFNYETQIRLGFFFGTLSLIGLWEVLAPRRKLTEKKWLRWTNNLGLVFFNSIISMMIFRFVFPAAAAGAALAAKNNGWGLFNTFEVPYWIAVILSVIILDFIIYMQHVMVHAVPLLWRLHRVHHADMDYDVTTGSRFHTIEIILSMGIKIASIILIGPPVIAVILFEIILNAMAMFNHGNISLPGPLDRILRWFVVTPDMHRVHHSIEYNESNSNFGFNISLWDRIFGTYKDQPKAGHESMTIGIHDFRESKQTSWISGMLLMPFTGKDSGYSINRRGEK
ncbi:MAG: sterol desaturase family protein [Spirochaetia bacterium]|nr:sterol desaturase family protein [Spirochaetia bacterium]